VYSYPPAPSSASAPKVQNTSQLCRNWNVVKSIDPPLSDVELRLVCGDTPDKALSKAWVRIPYNQAKYHLTQFLQNRAYHHPAFEVAGPADDPKITVYLGEKTVAHGVSVEGDPENEIEIERRRKIIGKPLTPALLDTLENWVVARLQVLGYACPVVKSKAIVDTGEIRLQVNKGTRKRIGTVGGESIPGLDPGILTRYFPFNIGDLYNSNLISIADSRVKTVGIVESLHIRKECRGDLVDLYQDVFSGPPRLLSFGVGINTEGLATGRTSWRNTRLGGGGSLLDVSANASKQLQSIQGNYNWYFLPYVSRIYLNPFVQFSHQNEVKFEILQATGQVGISTTVDHFPLGFVFFLGPNLSFYRTLQGQGAPDSRFLFLETRVQMKSHPFEYFANNPQAGVNLNLIIDVSDSSIYSDTSVQKYTLSGEGLWNWSNLDPPLWIWGIRGSVTTIITGDLPGPGAGLPASFYQFLGGAASIRGFGRLQLPLNSLVGGLSSAYLGMEGRLSNTLPFQLDPFLFVDVGAIGMGSLSVDTPIYWSPGIGVRWASPVGPVRLTLARGYTDGSPFGFQFYFSFGEEF